VPVPAIAVASRDRVAEGHDLEASLSGRSGEQGEKIETDQRYGKRERWREATG
jgi:hypothetical protein